MEFSVDRHVFQEAIQRTLGIVERKTTIPILSNILIKTMGETLRIVATDREIGLVGDYEASIIAPGEITINAKKIHEMIREMEGERVHVATTENKQAHITSGTAEYRIPGIPADDFPEVHREEQAEYFSISSQIVRRLIRRTFFAASTDESRTSLNGSFFKKEGLLCEMVATDGHRLARASEVLPPGGDEGVNIEGVIIPRKGLAEIRKLVDDGEGIVEMGVTGRVCVVRNQGSMLRLSLVDASYPDYRRVIPTDTGTKVQIEKHRILQSLRRMSVMSTELFNGVIISLSEGMMTLNSTNPDVGEANEEIPVDYHSAPFSVGYNVRYLIESIDSVDGELISFEMRDNGGPGVIQVPGNDSHLCIVMPIKIERK